MYENSLRRIRPGAAAIAVAALLSALPLAAAGPIPPEVAAAVADPARPEADRARDADRKPAEVIAFAGIRPGDKVADFIPGKGYFTRILCKLVGESGHVYAISVPLKRPDAPAVNPAPEHACTNVTASTLQVQKHPAPELWSSSDDPGGVYEYWSFSAAAENFAAPEPLDVIWTAENYHDLHNPLLGSPDMLAVNKALLAALKPGGLLLIEDHAAVEGSAARDTERLHRIEAEQVKREVLAAGFVFVEQSAVLRNATDAHTLKAHEMHDRTDRFLLKFRRP